MRANFSEESLGILGVGIADELQEGVDKDWPEKF